MLNKPFCFMSSKSKKDNNNFLSDEVRKLNIHKNILNSNDKNSNNRYNNIHDIVNNKNLERVTYYKVNHIYNERVRSGLIIANSSNQNREIGDFQLGKNNSAKSISNYNEVFGSEA